MTTQEWIEPYAGFELASALLTVESSYQAEKLTALGIDPDYYRGWVDPAFFIGISIQAGIDSGISAEGNVNMLTRLKVLRAPRLDEPMRVKGNIESVTEVPRGLRISTNVTFETTTGETLISVPRESLKPMAKAGDSSTPSRGAGSRPPPVIQSTSDLEIQEDRELWPEQTLGYSREGNAIHYDEAVAQQAGFRAPIIGGGQGVHYLTRAFWKLGGQSDWEIYFRRPIFWDDHIQVGCLANHEGLALCRGEKVLTEVAVRS